MPDFANDLIAFLSAFDVERTNAINILNDARETIIGMTNEEYKKTGDAMLMFKMIAEQARNGETK